VIRLLSWNVRSLRDSRDDVASVIRATGADLVCLQESPRVLSSYRAARLARDCGLQVASAGPPVGALTILASPQLRVVAAMREPLPWKPGRHRRGLARAVVEIDGVRVQVATFHLGLSLAEREDHAGMIVARMRENSLPMVLAGDVNETDTFPAWLRLSAGLQDAWLTVGHGTGRTYSTAQPRRRIDAVFVDSRLHLASCEVLETDEVARASDHRPIVVEVGWPTDAD
jgi:endonuclease/exonuclease/phosphatase family metal-dependent hydrolase